MQWNTDSYVARREVLKWAGMALAGSMAGISLPLKVSAQARTRPLGTARYAIFIQMTGAMSQMDCWDYKETKWTPKDLDPQKVWGDLYLPKTLFGKMMASKQMERISFVRSMRARELVHFNGQYHCQTGRALNVAVGKEIPAFGSVIAAELDSQRRPADTFPTYVSVNLRQDRVGPIGSGFFPVTYTGMDLDPAVVFDVFGGTNDGGAEKDLERRWTTLQRMAEVSPRAHNIPDKADDFRTFYDYAYRILNDPRWPKVFNITDEDKRRYGTNIVAQNFLLARNVLKADAGTRFIYISETDNFGWDYHSSIYDKTRPTNLYVSAARFDQAFPALLEDLAATPGHTPGKSLLDETLVVASSEFGRTTYVNNAAGRDHYDQVFTSALLGGGVKGQRIIGKTDELAGTCLETGWADKRQPVIDNLVATIYSTLGIDWRKKIESTPSGRGYVYVQTAPIGSSETINPNPLEELFV
jgi:hypothetical protein